MSLFLQSSNTASKALRSGPTWVGGEQNQGKDKPRTQRGRRPRGAEGQERAPFLPRAARLVALHSVPRVGSERAAEHFSKLLAAHLP